MTRDHLMGYPQAAAWSADAEPVYFQGVRIDFTPLGKRYALGVPNRVIPKPRVIGVDLAAPTLADFLPAGVMRCTNADRRGLSANPQIRDARIRGVCADLGRQLYAVYGAEKPYDTSD